MSAEDDTEDLGPVLPFSEIYATLRLFAERSDEFVGICFGWTEEGEPALSYAGMKIYRDDGEAITAKEMVGVPKRIRALGAIRVVARTRRIARDMGMEVA